MPWSSANLEGEYSQSGDLLTIVINSVEFLESNEYLDLFFFDQIDPMATHYFHAYLGKYFWDLFPINLN